MLHVVVQKSMDFFSDGLAEFFGWVYFGKARFCLAGCRLEKLQLAS